MTAEPLDPKQKSLMHLVASCKKEDGWSPVSSALFPILDLLPNELLEREKNEDGSGRCRLTATGENILPWI